MNKTIQIETRSVYGNEMMYVVGEYAEAIRCLTKKKTVSECDLRQLKALGFTLAAAPQLLPG